MSDTSVTPQNAPQNPWNDLTFVAFDTETTGQYPIDSEICEIAAMKWRGGRVIDTFQSLIKPSRPMGPEVIAIHGITNEMVVDAPVMRERIADFHRFIEGAVLIAHHAPFDLGFIAIEFEKAGLPLPEWPVLCSSLLSRQLFPESANHRLQTLIKFFALEQGAAHRALDDARACLEVGLRCMERVGDRAPLERVFAEQGGPLYWSRFSMAEVERTPIGKVLVQSIRDQSSIDMVYGAGSSPGEKRRVRPCGLVRSLDGDFLVAYPEGESRTKRYLVEKILSTEEL